jgi:MinD-like ATPase involved in chromosome partitioning or flagellar assembly
VSNPETIPDFPRIDAFFETDNRVIVTMLGVDHNFAAPPDTGDARNDALQFLWGITRSPGFTRPVRVHTTSHDGDAGVLVVTPEGDYYDEADPDDRWPIAELTDPDATASDDAPSLNGTAAAAPVRDVEPENPARDVSAGSTQFAERKSFIADGPIVEPARQGWRGVANRTGLRIGPGPAELLWREDVHLVSQHWPGPRTVAIGNPKGSANKTPTAVMLSAVFARYGGAGVLAWDNNETRGSLAWRTQRSNHEATVLDLLPRVPALLGTSAQSAEMSYFAHHQPADKFDVLRSDQSVDGDHEVSADDVDQIHQVAARYYRMIVMDSGNNERATNWRAMMQHADALVIPCTNVEDTAEAGARMLESLARRDEHSRKLAQNAVAIISKRTPGKDPNMERIVHDFTPLVRDVVTIPYDKALLSGVIQFEALKPSTKRAWLRAAAAVARGL